MATDIITQAILDAMQKQLKTQKPGTPEYEQTLAIIRQFGGLEQAQANAEKKQATADKDKKIQAKIDDVTRQRDTAAARGQKTDSYDKQITGLKKQLSGATPDTTVKGTTGTGTKTDPLTVDGKPFSGMKDGKSYKDGVIVPKTVTVDNKGKTTDGKTPGQSTLTLGQDAVKTAYVGYLKTTFASLADKTQKAEIDNLLAQAKNGNWTEQEFMDHLKGTTWWQTNNASLKQFFLDSHDPRNAANFAQSLSNTESNVITNLEKMGVQVIAKDPVTGNVVDNSQKIKGMAMTALQNGWTTDSAQFQNYIATNADIVFTGGGTVGSVLDNVKRTAVMYGVNLDKNQLDAINRGLLDPKDGRDAQWYINDIKNQAFNNPLYAPFADTMRKNNTDLYSVTSGYREQMAKYLEVDPTQITWNDLMNKAVDPTTGSARTLADFTTQVRKDPLWQRTQNAKETYSNMALDLMKEFGFVG